MKRSSSILLHGQVGGAAAELVRLIREGGTQVVITRDAPELRRRLEEERFEIVALVDRPGALRPEEDGAEPGKDQLRLAEVERRHILQVLALTCGNKTRAARLLDVDTKTLYNKLKLYGMGQVGRRRRGVAPRPA